MLLGYTDDSRSKETEAVTEAAAQYNAENTYLSMFVTIEPQLAVPEPFHDKVLRFLHYLSHMCMHDVSQLFLICSILHDLVAMHFSVPNSVPPCFCKPMLKCHF